MGAVCGRPFYYPLLIQLSHSHSQSLPVPPSPSQSLTLPVPPSLRRELCGDLRSNQGQRYLPYQSVCHPPPS